MITSIPATRAPKTKKFKLGGAPLSEDQISMFVSHYDKYGSFPGSKIPCSVTGKATTCVGPWLKKKIKEFGSAEKLLRGYVCRKAGKTKPKTGSPSKKSKSEDSNPLVKENGRYDIPAIKFNSKRPMTLAELEKDSENVCLRPDIYLSNGRHCDGCGYFKICRNSRKTLPKQITFDGENFISKETQKETTQKKK